MDTGGLSPAAWTRVTVRAAETMRYEVATRPPEARELQTNNALERVSAATGLRFDPGAIALSAAEQTQTAAAVARRKQANLKSMPKEGEDDELPGARGRRGAARAGAARSARSFLMDADGNLLAFGGGDAGAFLGGGASEEPIFKAPSQLAAEAGEESANQLRTSVGKQAVAGFGAAAERESYTLAREQKRRSQSQSSGQRSRPAAVDDPTLLLQNRAPPATSDASARPATPSLFPPARNPDDPYFVPRKIGSESIFRLGDEEKLSIFETVDGQSIFQTEERESLFDVGEVDPIFEPVVVEPQEASRLGADAGQMQVEKEVILAMENQVLEPVRKLEPAKLAALATDRYR